MSKKKVSPLPSAKKGYPCMVCCCLVRFQVLLGWNTFSWVSCNMMVWELNFN